MVWISYGRGPLGRVEVVEDNYAIFAGVKSADKGIYSRATTTTTIKVVEPIVTGRVVAVERENRFPWTLISALILLILLIIITFVWIETRSKSKKEEKRHWYEK